MDIYMWISLGVVAFGVLLVIIGGLIFMWGDTLDE